MLIQPAAIAQVTINSKPKIKTMKRNSLVKLADFKIANSEVLKSIIGGTEKAATVESKKKDVDSTMQDSASDDK